MHELPGVPVVNEGDRCVGIITERDLILSGENEDLHLPHYFQLFGGFVFVERFSHFEERLRKAVAATAEDLMTPEPVTIEPGATVARGRARDRRAQAQPAAGDRARPARRRRDPPRRARGAHAGVGHACARWPGWTWARSSATCARLAAVAAPAALCAVVKADGYGHGMVAGRARRAGGRRELARGGDGARRRAGCARRASRARCW